MAYKMSKCGSLDNEITNEFFCDTPSDLQNIPEEYIVLGSVAVVLNPFQMLIANSNKEWIDVVEAGG